MKNYKHIFLTAILCLVSLISAIAQDARIRIVESDDPETFKLIYVGKTEQDLNVKLINSKGAVILKNRIKNSKGFLLPLSFKGMSSERYLVEVSCDEFKLSEEIHFVSVIDRLKDSLSVEFDKDMRKSTVSSNSTYSGDWGIFIFNENSEKLIADKIENSSFNSRIYDLNGAPGHELKVVVMFNEEVVSHWRFNEF